MSDDVDISEWAVVTTSSRQFLARLSELELKARVFADWLPMLEAYEYHVVMKQAPKGIERQIIILPVGFLTTPTLMFARPTEVVLCRDMSEADQREHAKFVRDGQSSLTASRAAKAGLTLVGDKSPR